MASKESNAKQGSSGSKASINLQYLRHKVEKYLAEYEQPNAANERGEYVLRRGNTAIVVSVSESPDGLSFVDLTVVMGKEQLPKCKNDEQLYKALLYANVTDELGKFALVDNHVQVKYRLLGNDLDRDELGYSVLMLLKQAEHIQERVQMAIESTQQLAGTTKKK